MILDVLLCCFFPMVSFNSLNSTSPFSFMVLLVDHDFTHLMLLKQILLSFGYKVSKFRSAEAAIAALRKNNYMFDIVVCGVLMSDVDGLKLIQIAGLELDIPVVLITSDLSHEIALQAILKGACECLEKPVQPQTLKHIWQYVVEKRRHEFSYLEFAPIQALGGSSTEQLGRGPIQASGGSSIPPEELDRRPSCSNPKAFKRRREEEEGQEQEREQRQGGKKQRFIWTDKPHQVFVDAVNSLTLEKAVPKKILEYMRFHGVQNMTRAIVASHLQKYRLYLRKLENNEFDKASQSIVSLDATKDNNSSGCPSMKEDLKSKENVICATKHCLQPQLALEQLGPPILSNQFSNIAHANSNGIINGNSVGSSNNCPYLKILEDYEGTYKSQMLENLRVSNNSYSHSIGEDYFINTTSLDSRLLQDELEQHNRMKYNPSQSNLPDNSYVLRQNLGGHH